MSELTPMLKQYMEIKREYEDYILFYRLGDFYEMFFEDAIQASKVLGIALTKRNAGGGEKAPLCGVPFHSADSYLAKLIAAGLKVAICDQLEEPKDAKGLVKRGVTKLLTPGTLTDPDMISASIHSFLMSVAEDDDKIALAYADVSTGLCKMKLFDADDTESVLDAIYLLEPKELLISDESPLYPLLKDFAASLNVAPLLTKKQKKRSSHAFSVDTIKRFFSLSSLSAFGIDEDSPASVEALSSLLEYLELTQKTDLKHIKQVSVDYGKDRMHLDTFTVRNLELTESMRSGEKRGSLLFVLDKTMSSMGARLLREWLIAPLLKEEEIRRRLDAVEYLKHEILIRKQLRERLGEIYDFERLMTKCVLGTLNPRDVLALLASLKVLPDIRELISGESGPLYPLYRDFDTPDELCAELERAIRDDAPLSVRHGSFIKSGYDSELDALNELLYNSEGLLHQIEEEERERLGIKTLKIGYNKVFGYYVEISKAQADKAPEDYIRKQTLANGERYILPKLKDLENRILSAKDKALALEFELFESLRQRILGHLDQIGELSKKLAVIDVLSTFAFVADRNNYVKPIIDDTGLTEIKDGRHPVVEQVINSEDFVCNDTLLGGEDNVCMIITGPNMAGKSTYLRQVALITLMAQIGCFVPASYAKIALADRIFTRVGASDDLFKSQSTFMLEMLELASILNHAGPKSLIILDEVGRGTATYDGLSIAWSSAEYIASKLKARSLYATHYHEMTELEKIVPGIVNYRIAAVEKNDEILFLRKLERGSANKSFGVQVAKLAGIPKEVITRAKSILKDLESSDIVKPKLAGTVPEAHGAEPLLQSQEDASGVERENALTEVQREALEVAERLRAALKAVDINSLTPLEALLELQNLKELL